MCGIQREADKDMLKVKAVLAQGGERVTVNAWVYDSISTRGNEIFNFFIFIFSLLVMRQSSNEARSREFGGKRGTEMS